MPSFYKIISEGYPCEGQSKEEVIERISFRFKMDIEKAARLVSGKAVVLKSGIDRSTMQKYSKTLESIGLKFKIESVEAENKLTNHGNPANSFACPKCGHENNADINDPMASCVSCGVFFKKVAAKEKAPEKSDQTTNKDIKTDTDIKVSSHQEGIEKIKGFYNELPKSIKIFWRLMVIVYAIALLRAIQEGGVGIFIGVAIGAGVAWFYIPYHCMRVKGLWPWVFTIVWTFPFGLGLLSESAKTYFLSNDH